MANARDDFFKALEEKGISVTEAQKKQISDRISNVLNYEPKIGVFGKTGSGKSSLCNALFGADLCPISDVEACTRNPQELFLNIDGKKGIKIIDVPGVGENGERDKEYAKLYAELLPDLDLVLWLIKADDRALSSDEVFFNNIVKPHLDEGKPFFFVLNQVDKIEPFREWNEEKHEPGPKQFQNIYRKRDDVSRIFNFPASKIIPVSASENYYLTELIDEIVRALPPEHKVTFYRAVNESHRSEKSDESVSTSFNEIVTDIFDTVVQGAKEVVKTVFFGIGKKLIEHIPFIGGGGGCYITTAVCRNKNRPDNCYELETFRKFRDNWLKFQPDGKELIKRYYRNAPTIVKLIDSSENKDEIYKEIEHSYLNVCLKYIENNDMQACKDLYVEMVEDLISRYLIWA